VGIAVSDDLGMMAFPVGIVDLRHETLDAVATLVNEHNADGIVAGLPTTMRGEEGYQARAARVMAEELAEKVSIRIVFWDERLTSYMADRVLEGRSKKRKSRSSGERDAIAAAIMLQDYLDANPL
jgi:putative Holliday junction resolvase